VGAKAGACTAENRKIPSDLTVCEVRPVVLCRHDRGTQVIVPDPRRPVTHSQEVLGKEGVPLQGVNRPVVPGVHRTDPVRRALTLALAQQHGALLRPDKEVGGASSGVIAERNAPESGAVDAHLKWHSLDGLAQLADVPEEQLSVRGHGRALGTRLALQPGHIVDGIPVTLLNGGRLDRRAPLAIIPVLKQAVVTSANHNVGVLGVVLDTTQRGRRGELQLGVVGVVNVPHVAGEAHTLWLPLELQDSVRNRNLSRPVGVPADARGRALDRVRVPEDREGLCRGRLPAVVHRISHKVLLVDVNGIVLANHQLEALAKSLDGADIVLRGAENTHSARLEIPPLEAIHICCYYSHAFLTYSFCVWSGARFCPAGPYLVLLRLLDEAERLLHLRWVHVLGPAACAQAKTEGLAGQR
jgi:hypothetical protein